MMRYAIHFTPTPSDPLTLAAASWLGRDVYSGHVLERPSGVEICLQELSYYTALPRRLGFHAALKAPFELREGVDEAALLRALMCFASAIHPFELPRLEIGRLSESYGLFLSQPSSQLEDLASRVVRNFDSYAQAQRVEDDRALLTDHLSASQLSNYYRWGDPYVMDEFRFQMALTSSIDPKLAAPVDRSMRRLFEPLLDQPLEFANLALFVEEERGAPFRVHSLHPLGPVEAHKRRLKVKRADSDT